MNNDDYLRHIGVEEGREPDFAFLSHLPLRYLIWTFLMAV